MLGYLSLSFFVIAKIASIGAYDSDDDDFYYKEFMLGNGLYGKHSFEFSHRDRNNQGRKLSQMTLTIAIYPDKFPEDTGYSLTDGSGRKFLEQKAGFLSNKDSIYEESVSVTSGQQFTLTVTDLYGDGLQEPGFFGAYFGPNAVAEEEIIRHESFEGKSKSIVFLAERPDTPAPSTTPSPTRSPAPTHSPTSCLSNEREAARVVDRKRNFNPRFQTVESILGIDYCRLHRDYASCTTEKRQHCQWNFLGTSALEGICRLDPVSTCITDGTCQCDTIDFRGGGANMADGIIFHAPMTLTAQDIAKVHNIEYSETIDQLDKNEFISRVDFSHRVKNYEFKDGGSYLQKTYTAMFKLHHTYWDTTMIGNVWDGLRMKINVESNGIKINGVLYEAILQKWTCNSIVITSTHLYVGRKSIIRDISREKSPPFETNLKLGSFTGDLFDVRLYEGTLSWTEIREFGAKCTTPDDPAALEYRRDISNPYFTFGCEPDFERLPVDEGGPIPSKGGHTYGSSPFATMWVRPEKNPFNERELLDVPEYKLDKEHFFQQSKIQSYLWERFLLDLDLIGYNQKPYSFVEYEEQVPKFASTFWNNPCRWVHNFNNGWQYPIYGHVLPKWEAAAHGNGDNDATFDISDMYQDQSSWAGERLTYVAHELFHGVQLNLSFMYAAGPSRWLLESTAEFGADFTFPAADKVVAPFTMTPAYPIGMFVDRDANRAAHFVSPRLSFNEEIQTLHMYGSWILWWFLSEQVGLPQIVGQMFTNWFRTSTYTAGEIFLLRELVENANLDFGDVWSTCIAHTRTWDFPKFGNFYKVTEQNNFDQLLENSKIPATATLEGRKTAVEIDRQYGTNGQWIAGPAELRPGPNGWNCLTIRKVSSEKIISIQIEWDQGMGFNNLKQPKALPQQQLGCDEDPRFYNSVVVAHDEARGVRRYWKLKGKKPSTLNIATGASGSFTIHIILVPTPPSDYVLGIIKTEYGSDGRVDPIPSYGYKYNVQISDGNTASAIITPEAEKENGLMKFAPAKPGWWPVRCTCLEDPDVENNRCVRPTFDGVPASNIVPDSGFCFAGETTVEVKGIGPIYMKDLKVGDMVKVADNKYSKVYSFGHKDQHKETDYVIIYSDSRQQPLKVSQQHMIFIRDELQSKNIAIPASLIRTGDKLMLSSGKYAIVSKISKGLGVGAFAPFTYSGIISVNGILASNYVSIQEDSKTFLIRGLNRVGKLHWISHAFQAPHRLMCHVAWSYCKNEKYTKDGISLWVSYPFELFRWLLSPSSWPYLLLVTPFIVLLALFLSVLEPALIWIIWVLPLIILLHFTRNIIHISKKEKRKEFKINIY